MTDAEFRREFEQHQARMMAAAEAAERASSGRPPTAADGLNTLVRGMAIETKDFVRRSIHEALEPLQRRVAELEARPGAGPAVSYAGVYEQQRSYASGQLVTKAGGLWLALRDTRAEAPGNSSAWRLVVKRGDA